MRKERKEALLHQFPPVTAEFEEQMKGKGAKNFAVMLTRGDELFVRCFHRYYDGSLVERQRYVFAKDGFCRYGSDYGTEWAVRTDFREPVFCACSYGYSFDNSYTVLNFNAIKNSCMKYSCADKYYGNVLMEYLRLYCKHPNVEYLMKSGYNHLIVEDCMGYWGGTLSVCADIDWKSNDLLKMLRLNRTEFKLLKGSEGSYEAYIAWRKDHPKFKPDELLSVARVFGFDRGTAKRFSDATGVRIPRLARYLDEQKVKIIDYSDYIGQCRHFEYDMRDTAVCMPHDFQAMHTRLSEIIKYQHDENVRQEFSEQYSARKALEYEHNGIFLRQPESVDEITAEGKALKHCVGGYGERHAKGKLHILFIRNSAEPDTPFYTLELSTSGSIVQVRGLKNCAPTEEVKAFVEHYKKHIKPIFKRKERISA